MKKLMLMMIALAPLTAAHAGGPVSRAYEDGFVDGVWAAARVNLWIQLEASGISQKAIAAVLNRKECTEPPAGVLDAAVKSIESTDEVVNHVYLAGVLGEVARRTCLGKEE